MKTSVEENKAGQSELKALKAKVREGKVPYETYVEQKKRLKKKLGFYKGSKKQLPVVMLPRPIIVPRDDNAFSILSAARSGLRKAGYSEKDSELVLAKAKEGDYDHLIQIIMKYVIFK